MAEYAYAPSGVFFDGATFLVNDALAAADSPYLAASFWVRTGDSDSALWVVDPAHLNRTRAFVFGSNSVITTKKGIELSIGDSTNLTVIDLADADFSRWSHVFFACDTSQSLYAVYINAKKVPITRGLSTGLFPYALFNGRPFFVGADNLHGTGSDGAGDFFLGEMAEFWLSTGTNYIDANASVADSTIRRFISKIGRPMDPIGFPPAAILLCGNSNEFIVNKGSGGPFAVTGFVRPAFSPPVLPPPSRFYEGDRHIRRSGDDYGVAMVSLLPQGQAWPREPDSVLVRAMRGLAEYWGFVDGRAADLLERESDPRITLELLTDWERAWGLPDPCFSNVTTIAERQRLLVLWMTLLGGQSRAFFNWVANFVGYEIQIREYAPWMFGVSECGPTDDGTGYWRWEIGPPEIRFYWTALVSTVSYIWWRYGQAEIGVDPHLLIGVPLDLECMLQRWKPAQTDLIFNFDPSNFWEGWPSKQAIAMEH